MERHFVLPVTIAAAFHAAVLFGLHPAHVSVVKDPVRTPTVSPSTPPVEVELTSPVTESKPEDAVAPKGSSEKERPTAPELPPSDSSNRVKIDMPPATHAVTTVGKFDLTPFGVPDGREIGSGVKNDFGIRDLDSAPRTRMQGPPQYPYAAKSAGLSGTVTVEFTVDENGAVRDPHVVSSTDRVFDDATVRAVAKWRFEPGKRAGRIVRFRMAVPVVFNLSES